MGGFGIPHPLGLAAGLLLVSFALPRLRPRWPLWAGLLGRILLFAAMTMLVQASLGSPLAPRFGTQWSGQRFWEQLVEAGWWWVAAGLAIGLVRLVVVLENRPRESRIVSDLLAGAIGVATLLATINFALDVPIRGLLATSGVIAIVLGLALQSTLSDVFSGIAVGLERPYEAGDLLWVEGGIEGTVVQINWRSTQIMTGEHNIAVVPNSIIAKARLVNRSAPTPERRATVELLLDPSVPAERCRETLLSAVRACRLLLEAPAASIDCIALRGDGTQWEIGFSVPASARLAEARDELLAQAHRHLFHAGIAQGVAGTVSPPAAPPTLADMMRRSDLFGVVAEAEREQLLPYFTQFWMHPGEVLVRPGEVTDAMVVLAAGTMEIDRDGRVILRMSPGESLGAIGLITGQPSLVTATALTTVRAFRIGRDALSAAIRTRPEIALALEELAQRGKLALEREAAGFEQQDTVRPEMFLGRLRSLLRVLGGK